MSIFMLRNGLRPDRVVLIALLGTSLAACDKGEHSGEAADANQASARRDDGASGQAATAVAEAEPTFDPEQSKKLRKSMCDYLSADMVAEHFEVEADELTKVSIMGCTYSWSDDDDGKIVEVSLMIPRVHDSLDDAKTWFNNATASKTKAQIDAEYDKVKAAVEDQGKLDSKLEKDTAKGITDMAKSGTPDEGISYTDVDGIASQARASSADGSLWIRTGNLTFQVRAYAGAAMEQPPFDPKNPNAMIAAAMEANKKWVAETIDEREAAAKKIAPDIVAALAKAAGS